MCELYSSDDGRTLGVKVCECFYAFFFWGRAFCSKLECIIGLIVSVIVSAKH